MNVLRSRSCTRTAFALAVATGTVAVPVASAAPVSAVLIGASGALRPGDQAFVQIETEGRVCSVVGLGADARSVVRRAAVPAGGLQITWRVARAARRGPHQLRIRCASRASRLTSAVPLVLRMQVSRSGSTSRGGVLDRGTVRLRAYRVAAPGPEWSPAGDGLPDGVGDPSDYAVTPTADAGGTGGFGTYLPLTTGTRVTVTQGPGGGFSHTSPYTRYAVDFGLPAGTPVRAGFRGVVARVQVGCGTGSRFYSCGGGFGNYVYLKAPDGSCALHAHLRSVAVSPGDQVPKYTQLGESGSTGFSTGAHLHYDRVDCTTNRSLPWAPAEADSVFTGATLVSANSPEAPPPAPTQPPVVEPGPAPQPVTKTIVVNNTVIWTVPPGYREDTSPAPVVPRPDLWRLADAIASFGSGAQLTATCWVNGRRITDGNDSWAGDDPWQYASTLMYGVRLPDGRTGYIHSAWSTKRQDTLGLPQC